MPPGSTVPSTTAPRLPPSAIAVAGSPSNGTPRTPRTPNRVRFDLRPTIVNGAANGDVYHHPYNDDDERESFDVDDADPLGVNGVATSSDSLC